jgi:hypothetical protein
MEPLTTKKGTDVEQRIEEARMRGFLLGKRQGREEVIEQLVSLLGIDERIQKALESRE